MAEQAVEAYLADPSGPTASLVAIENSTGEVRAMVGGRSYARTPFNLAINGQRQPGSAFKAFDLAAALRAGISPYSVWTSKRKIFVVPSPRGPERFVVRKDFRSDSTTTCVASRRSSTLALPVMVANCETVLLFNISKSLTNVNVHCSKT